MSNAIGLGYLERTRRLYRIDTKALKARIDDKAFYEKELTVQINRTSGWIKAGVCPFHDTDKPGSFAINLDGGGYQCFVPDCGVKGGDVISFLMQKYGLSFQAAIKRLARDWS
jgi:DNA primase